MQSDLETALCVCLDTSTYLLFTHPPFSYLHGCMHNSHDRLQWFPLAKVVLAACNNLAVISQAVLYRQRSGQTRQH